jgi:hypothetical protein
MKRFSSCAPNLTLKMNKYTIELTREDLAALRHFLEMTNLRGADVPAFLAIVKALNEAKENQETDA